MMGFLIPPILWLIHFIMTVQPVQITEVESCPPYTQGYVKDNQIYLCPELTMPRSVVINHETVHLIQNHWGGGILMPPSILNYMVKETMEEREILSVILHYEQTDYINQEFEARVLQNLHPRVIMTMYRLSSHVTHSTG